MTEGVVLFIVGQTAAIIVTIIGAAWRIGSRLTKIESNQSNEIERRREQRADHDNLDKRVQGISRTVERHATLLGDN